MSAATPRPARGSVRWLSAVVPIEIARIRDWPHEQRQQLAHDDQPSYSGKHCASTVTALAWGLAAVAFYQLGW